MTQHGSRHAICDGCYDRQQPGRVPFRLAAPNSERCCFCGALTESGIYTRFPGTPEHCPDRDKDIA